MWNAQVSSQLGNPVLSKMQLITQIIAYQMLGLMTRTGAPFVGCHVIDYRNINSERGEIITVKLQLVLPKFYYVEH